MTNVRARLVGATLGAVLAFGIGGASMAMAQTDDSTTTTEPPAAETPQAETPAAPVNPRDDGDCEDKGTGGGGRGGTRTQPSTPTSDV